MAEVEDESRDAMPLSRANKRAAGAVPAAHEDLRSITSPSQNK